MKRLLTLAALLLPAPALADVTATYDLHGAVLTVEADDGGDSRAGVEGKFELIRHGGIDYIVICTPDGAPHVARADAAMAKFIERSPPPSGAWKTELSAEGDATVAGFAGTVWRFGPANERPLEFVMSSDPALAPVGQVFARASTAFAQMIDSHSGAGSDAGQGVAALLSHGAPIRISETAVEPAPGKTIIELRSVSRAEIDAHRFDLPGPVLGADAFFAAIAPPPPPVPEEPATILEPAVPERD